MNSLLIHALHPCSTDCFAKFTAEWRILKYAKYILMEIPWTSDGAAFSLPTRITSSEKTLVSRPCPACNVFNLLHSCAKIYARTVLCVYFEMFYFELLDPEILSAASSILCPSNIECSGFDPMFLRFCTFLRHIYVRIRTYRASDLAILRYNPRQKRIRVASPSSCRPLPPVKRSSDQCLHQICSAVYLFKKTESSMARNKISSACM